MDTSDDLTSRSREPMGPFRWCFEHRGTGRITIAQFPNWSLWIVIAALAVELLFHPTGRVGLAVTIVKDVSLAIWAFDEVLRGCNPWRRALGAGALIYEAYSIFLA